MPRQWNYTCNLDLDIAIQTCYLLATKTTPGLSWRLVGQKPYIGGPLRPAWAERWSQQSYTLAFWEQSATKSNVPVPRCFESSCKSWRASGNEKSGHRTLNDLAFYIMIFLQRQIHHLNYYTHKPRSLAKGCRWLSADWRQKNHDAPLESIIKRDWQGHCDPQGQQCQSYIVHYPPILLRLSRILGLWGACFNLFPFPHMFWNCIVFQNFPGSK